jgi:oligoribonuclease NrnB/cAMP/cGMP phosphodiesterase (DHH superfamily)
MRSLYIYHANCMDGLGAAFAAYFAGGKKEEFHAASYDDGGPPFEKVDSQTMVYLLDFCYKEAQLRLLCDQAAMVVVLDHHKSAIEMLTTFSHERLSNRCDIDHSGAMVAWNYFFGESTPPPRILQLIEDRDLWKFQYPDSKPAHAALQARNTEFWDLKDYLDAEAREDLVKEGIVLLRQFHSMVAQIIRTNTRMLGIADYVVPAVNANYMFASEVGNRLCENTVTFSATYHDTDKGRAFSLRSCEGGMDVSEIAKQFGGGGHKHAAGFTVPRSHPLAQA